jgi:hypothetical protein
MGVDICALSKGIVKHQNNCHAELDSASLISISFAEILNQVQDDKDTDKDTVHGVW